MYAWRGKGRRRAHRTAVGVVLAALLWLTATGPLWAQEPVGADSEPAAETTPAAVPMQPAPAIDPALVRIAGSRGDEESRRLLLRPPLGVEEPRVFAQDLIDADGTTILPADAISMSFPAAPEANAPLAADLHVALGDTPSGRYSGQVLLFGNESEAAVSLDVAVKDRWGWPLFTLLTGVILGMAMTWYRQRLGPRDRLLVAVSDTVREAERHEELRVDGRGVDFRRRIDLHTSDAGAALRSNAFDSAEKHLKSAQRTLQLWTREESSWLEALKRRDDLLRTLESELPASGADSPYVDDLRAAIAGALTAILDQATTGELAEFAGSLSERYDARLGEFNGWLARYRSFVAESAALRKLLGDLSDEQVGDWGAKLSAQDAAMAELRPVTSAQDAGKAAALVAEQKAAAAIIRDMAEGATHEIARPGIEQEQAADQAAPAWDPLKARLEEEKQVNRARTRTWVAMGIGFIVAAGLLGGAGFQELYVANPIFGSRRWFDYFALLAWGVGAEATSSAIAGVLRSWDLPFIGKGKEPDAG